MRNELAKRLRALREKQREKQSSVASSIGITESTLSAYEKGTRKPSFDVLLKIAQYYNVSIDYLVGNEYENQSAFSQLHGWQREFVIEVVNLLVNKFDC